MKYVIRFLRSLIFIAGAGYVACMAVLTYSQRDFIYHPAGTYMTPEEAGAPSSFKELVVTTEDGLELKGWYSPATTKAATIIFFHGNADYLSNMLPMAQRYVDAGYGFVIAEYRGYSGLPGKPTENNLYADGRAYVHKAFDSDIDIGKIVLMGHSLGAGVATQMAHEFHPAALVLLAPFKSITSLAEKEYPYFPVSFMLLDHFANDEKIADIRTPLLIEHGTADKVVPTSHGQRLFDLAQEPKYIHILEGWDHSDLFDMAFENIELFIDNLVKR